MCVIHSVAPISVCIYGDSLAFLQLEVVVSEWTHYKRYVSRFNYLGFEPHNMSFEFEIGHERSEPHRIQKHHLWWIMHEKSISEWNEWRQQITVFSTWWNAFVLVLIVLKRAEAYFNEKLVRSWAPLRHPSAVKTTYLAIAYISNFFFCMQKRTEKNNGISIKTRRDK